ncbi:TIGR04141 family sporadically distributed protein [Nonomuraea sp. SYSU D8015]|uniref:TIGR04141 family sporadically distributed protein n=1 Tax=Nonomuraea sp. SYSU D8015 TaxID=2593644 RepID=UPI001660D90B|nr:DUF6119 family protein [Nonomuraea sp. SYSU D8015]
MTRPRTRDLTLYRLTGVEPTPYAMFSVLDLARLDELGVEPRELYLAGAPALWVAGQQDVPLASWCEDASVTTGLNVAFDERRSFGLLMIAVDGAVYAIGYGQGHWWIPDERKDHGFGIRFAVRRLDPDYVQDVARRRIGARGRSDLTLVPGGMPIWALGIEEQADVIRRMGGRSLGLNLTFSKADERPVRLEAGVGLTMRFGVRAEDLVADIREIARVCREDKPHPSLEFVDHIRPIADPALVARLDAGLDDVLGRPDAAELICVVPTDCLPGYAQARRFEVKIGSAPQRVDELDVGLIRFRALVQAPERRVQALRKGKIRMFRDDACTFEVGSATAIKWLEVVLTVDERRYFLLDGEWYEIDPAYLQAKLDEIAPLFTGTPTVALPMRHASQDEKAYNNYVADVCAGYLCMDRALVRTKFFIGNGFEACDLLGPDDVLVHVKFARGADTLSHLFTQGVVSTQALLQSDEALRRFKEKVEEASGGRRGVPENFRPRKVVFAIHLKTGATLTPQSLFPLARVALANAARLLRTYGVEVEVVGIRAADDVLAA